IQRFFEGRSMADIADEMSVSQPTVSRRVESGILKLRDTLRKRGVIVAATALISLLTENAVEAAPALVMKELGKIALLGTTAVSSGSSTAATGALIGIKAKIIAATAAAAIGTVGVVAYKDITTPAKEPTPPVVSEVEQPEPPGPAESSEGPGSPEIVSIDREPPKVTVDAGVPENGGDIARSGGAKAGSDEDIPADTGTVRKSGGYGGGRGGGFRFWAGPSKEKEEPDAEDSNSTDDDKSPPRRVGRRSRRPGGR
ncbi:MAG: sigma factor-like helix-turn-helix DNA-binding protein, partial [Planctomycetota bacterium]